MRIAKRLTTNGRRSTVAWKPRTIRRLRELEERDRRLKQMYAELSLDHRVLKDVLTKKALAPAVKRQLIAGLRAAHKLSERQACKIVMLRRSVLSIPAAAES